MDSGVVQLRFAMILTRRCNDRSTFDPCVVEVRFSRTEKQVGRIDAEPVIATMEHTQPGWLATVVQTPRMTVCCAPRPAGDPGWHISVSGLRDDMRLPRP